jgi:putative hemin transport protein
MALTRNAFAVHEKTGPYEDLLSCEHSTLISGHNIDLCLRTGVWHSGFAVMEETHLGPRRSLQFFDTTGDAMHKIYLTEYSHADRYQGVIDIFRADDQSPHLELPTDGAKPALDALASSQDLPERWRRLLLADTTEATLIGRIAASALRELMGQLSGLLLPIQILVSNGGAMQLHDGPIEKLKITGPWFNVLDQGFNLHLNEMAMAGADIVRLTYQQRDLTGLLVRDQNQQTILTIAGQFDEADGESTLWRDLLLALPDIARV